MNILNTINDWLWSYLLIGMLLIAAVWFTFKSRGVQFRMFSEMWRLLAASGKKEGDGKKDSHHTVSSFQAFAVSIASRVGTGNLAGVATAIAIGGAGSIFWMWVIALLGSASAFVESTLAQLYKVRGENSFKGGPAYYIQKGLGKRWWAVIFAVLISITFGLAFNSVQSNTMTAAAKVSFGWDPLIVGAIITIASMLVIFGGIQRISRFSEIVVPVMAIAYILLALFILIINVGKIPHMFATIVSEAFTGSAALGGGVGSALLMGIKRGLFSNEAGEGSAPNVAATASVSHPVKQGLLQSLAVFTDTLLICTCTAFIILMSGIYENGESGIALTQSALESEVGSIGSTFVAIAVFFFAFTSIVSNYYYGETNLQFISSKKWLVTAYRILVGCIVMVGAVTSLEFVWGMADIFMGLMTLCNLLAIFLLGKYAMRLLRDYQAQRKAGKNPVYYSSTIPEIADETECWDSTDNQ
ncbi:MAG: alanine:cation symporter family protein [Muribaculaceae bacterium]|nr:alanine:cation symporter family protein [Muribaculaceae bacterium]